MIPGKGESGIPYIHIFDVIQIIKRCIALHSKLESYEIFMASQNGAVLHKELFLSVQQSLNYPRSLKPIYISPRLVKIGLNLKLILGSLVHKVPIEQPWMLKYIDCPWIVDNTFTQRKLELHCSPNMNILERLPVILKLYEKQKNKWIDRNVQRNLGNYLFSN